MESSRKTVLRSGGPAGLVLCLTVLAIISACLGGIAFIAILIPAAVAEGLSGAVVLQSLACLLGGLAVACGMWALSWLVRCQFQVLLSQRPLAESPLPSVGDIAAALSHEIAESLAMSPPAAPPAPVSPAPSAEPEPAYRNEELLSAVRELSANLLFTDEERQIKRRRQQDQIGGLLVQQIRDATVAGDFARAERSLRRLEADFPAEKRAAELGQSLQRARSAALEADVEQARQKASDLMALARFDDAREVAAALRARHPAEPRADELLAMIGREGEAFFAEQKRRAYRDLQKQVTDRRWRAALENAREFIRKFPDSGDAKLVSAQLQTIEENARIEEVRDLRDRIRDCLERRRYAEALQLANEVIRRFPESAAAAELAQQLPRLEELSRNGRGGPA